MALFFDSFENVHIVLVGAIWKKKSLP